MSQQINLCPPVLLAQPRFFSARFMGLALVVLMLVGGVWGGYELTDLDSRDAVFSRTLLTQKQALADLRSTVRQRQARAVPVELALNQELKTRQAQLLQLDRTLAALQDGLFRAGEGHASKLTLVARSVPTTAWVTVIKVDDERFELSGFTSDPASLNGWIERLEASPLLKGQKLAAVDVAKVVESAGISADAVQPLWSFSLVRRRDPALPATGASR